MSNWKTDLQKEITIENLPEEFQGLAEIIGLEATLQVMAHFAGMSIYIPFVKRLLTPIRDKHIRDEFTGFNHVELARKYEVTTTHIRNILQGNPSGRQGGKKSETKRPNA